MAETEDPEGSNDVLEVEEVEGDQICSRNYRFSKIGESVPITPDADFKYDTSSLPSRPLAVSDRFGVFFVGHSSGFCVARTKDVMNKAEELKNEGSGSSIQELSVVDVSIGKVSILALSTESSMLTVSVGSNLYFFSVAGLLNKDQEPSFSKSLNGSSCIKDMQWTTNSKDCYVVLTTDGNLYCGAGQEDLNSIMGDVDAFDWSMNGKFVAVAKNNYLSILSSRFKEKLRIKLSFKSWVGDSDASVVKVDSVWWVRPDCIFLGCYQLNADGTEEGYLVQVVTVKGGKITNASSNPVALSFSDAFLALNDDAIPSGSGPYMFLSYLDDRGLAFIANRKNTDQHIVLFGWPSDENSGAAMIEISNDAWLPTINLQSNSDDNLILGLAVDKVSHDEKVKIMLGEEDTEVSPCCVLLCLTVDGRLFIFHFASATGPSVLPEVSDSVSDEEEGSPSISPEHGPLHTSNEKQIGDQTLHELQPEKAKVDEPSGKAGFETHMRNGNEQVKSTAFSQLFKGGAQQDVSGLKNNRDQLQSLSSPKQDGAQQDVSGLKNNRDQLQSLSSPKQDGNLEETPIKTAQPLNPGIVIKDLKRFGNQELAKVKSSADSVSNLSTDKSDKTLFGALPPDFRASTESSGNLFCSATSPSVLPEVEDSVSDEEEGSPSISSEHGPLHISNEKQIGDQALHELQPEKVKVDEPSGKAGFETHMGNGKEQVKSAAFSQLFKGGVQQDVSGLKNNRDQLQSLSSPRQDGAQQDDSGLKNNRDQLQSLSPPKQDGNLEETPFKTAQPLNPGIVVKDVKRFGNQELAEVKSSADSVSNFSTDKSNKTLFGALPKDFPLGKIASAGVRGSTESSGNIGSTSLHSSSGSLSSGGIFSSKNFDVKSSPLPPAVVQGNRPDTSASIASFPGPQKFSFPEMTFGPSTSSNMLGQGGSAGAGITNSLPVFPNAQPSLGTSDFRVRSDKGNRRSYTPSRLLNSEPNLSEQRSVEEMAKELDVLLDSVEGPGGFYDVSVALHETSVKALEDGIWALSDRCRMWKGTMDQGLVEIQQLLDKTVQVLARKIYMEAIVKQATDSQYWDIWNFQKLSSELEMKRRHILEINQNLTNQLIDLERHLNTLDLQRFGDKGDVQTSHKSLQMKHRPSRHIQSLHSLHNTMNAQLAAAEKLSESLSTQMAVLSIEAEPVKRQNVRKELFETIGISYDAAAKAHLKKNQPSAVKNSEPETARRRRDSLDRNWANFEPPKTTVKRLLLQEDRQMSPGRSSLPTGSQKLSRLFGGSVTSRDIPGSQDAWIKQYSESQSNSSLWANYCSDSSKTLGSAVPSLGSGSHSTPIVSRDVARDSRDPTAERPRNRLTFTLKSDSTVINDSKSSQQSQSFLDQPSSNTTRSQATNIFQKKPTEFSESISKDAVISKPTTGNENQWPIVAESSSFWSRKSQESPLSTVSNASSTPAFSGKSFSLGSSTKVGQLGGVVSSSARPSLSVPVTSSAPSSFVFKDTTPTSTSALSQGKLSTHSGIKLDAIQTVASSGPSTSFPSFSSISSFGAPKEPVASSAVTPLVNIELNTSKPELSKSNTKTNESSTPQAVSMPKFGSKPDENSSAQTSPPQPTLCSDTSNLKLGPSIPSEPTSEPPTSSFSGSPLNVSSASSPALVVLNSKPEQPSVALTSFSQAITSSADGVGRENDNSDAAFTQEDEMEEEAPATTQLSLGNLGGFGLGSAPNPAAPLQNPFGASFGNPATNTPVASFSMTAPSGGLFRPASFNIQSSQPSQPSQQTNFGTFSGGFGSNTNQSGAGQGFGQPAQIGSGQQALGSVLGSFGQSRQLGAGLPGSVASSSPFGGGFGGGQPAGGFATASSGGGGFANLASGGGGFGSLATGGGGFAAAAPGGGGGFAAAATGSGGFAAAAATGTGGFAGSASGGFGAFSSQGGGAFSSFGSTGGTARPPPDLFTQMRR